MKSEQHVVKDDENKLPYHLIPPEALEGICAALQNGVRIHGERNWEEGTSWHRYFSAMMRHMWAWWRGEDTDQKSGLSHLWHAGACVMFLITYETRKIGTDDRP